MCAFEHAGDAEEVAKVVGACVVAAYEGWASQRAFDLDGESESRLAEAAVRRPRQHQR